MGNVSEAQPNVSEEQAKDSERERNHSESNGNVSVPGGNKGYKQIGDNEEEVRNEWHSDKRIKELEQEVLDLKIMNKGKDFFIEQLKEDRKAVVEERLQLVGQLTASVREIGVLETRLLQLEAPRGRIVETEEGRVEGAQDYAR
jgi:hypothetical protein